MVALPNEHINVFLPGAQKIQKTNSFVFACLTNTKKNKIIADPFFRTDPSNHLAKLYECPNSMLRVIIIPRNAVIIKKCEKLITISLEAVFIFSRCFGHIFMLEKHFVGTIDKDSVLPSKTSF